MLLGSQSEEVCHGREMVVQEFDTAAHVASTIREAEAPSLRSVPVTKATAKGNLAKSNLVYAS